MIAYYKEHPGFVHYFTCTFSEFTSLEICPWVIISELIQVSFCPATSEAIASRSRFLLASVLVESSEFFVLSPTDILSVLSGYPASFQVLYCSHKVNFTKTEGRCFYIFLSWKTACYITQYYSHLVSMIIWQVNLRLPSSFSRWRKVKSQGCSYDCFGCGKKEISWSGWTHQNTTVILQILFRIPTLYKFCSQLFSDTGSTSPGSSLAHPIHCRIPSLCETMKTVCQCNRQWLVHQAQ